MPPGRLEFSKPESSGGLLSNSPSFTYLCPFQFYYKLQEETRQLLPHFCMEISLAGSPDLLGLFSTFHLIAGNSVTQFLPIHNKDPFLSVSNTIFVISPLGPPYSFLKGHKEYTVFQKSQVSLTVSSGSFHLPWLSSRVTRPGFCRGSTSRYHNL